jgi:hypothetical protein
LGKGSQFLSSYIIESSTKTVSRPIYLLKLCEAGTRLVTVNYDTLIEIANGLQPTDWMSPEVNDFFIPSHESEADEFIPDLYV